MRKHNGDKERKNKFKQKISRFNLKVSVLLELKFIVLSLFNLRMIGPSSQSAATDIFKLEMVWFNPNALAIALNID